MPYYGYHQRIKQRIRGGELVGEFSTLPALRPIRPDHWPEYVDILADWRRGQCPARNLTQTARTATAGL